MRRSEEHTSELQSLRHLVCRLLLERYGDHRDRPSFPTRRSSDLMEVLRSLGVRHGIVVISKSDLATPDVLAIVREEIAGLVRDTFLEKAPVVEVSARTGAGLDAQIGRAHV